MSKIQVLNKGHVELKRFMGGDAAIIEAARECFQTVGNEKADYNLLKMLVAEKHTSPMEHCVLTFHVKAPIFVLRQWMRHRIGMSYNELSLRYCEANPEFFVPDEIDNKTLYLNDMFRQYEIYQNWIKIVGDVSPQRARELARPHLPLGLYSSMTWTCNVASLYHFLLLRSDKHAQKEIREYAMAVCELARQAAPITISIMEEIISGKS